MSDCCSPQGYRWIFSERNARAEARRYRRKGLDATSRRIVEFLRGQGVEGRTLLEVGGGIGAIQMELLKAGAAHAISVELTPTYERVAGELLAEAGLADRVERRVMDFAEAAAQVEAADVVIMNRVICCYPDMPRLAGAAAEHARQVLVMSYPRQAWWTVVGLALANAILWLTRRRFHVFLHPPAQILATSERRGLRTVLDDTGALWTVAALRRTA
ncbi:MAG TPA: methyltransferase domain-containing protein [Candidatus Dormibacteraeota bacterium]|nr:methyltransferase domain-containing protein [Candidatus Dormibacteraeota bacterium]